MEKQIEKDIKNLIYEYFNVKADSGDNLYLLGLMPRDVIKLVYLLESKYGIQFSESELLEVKFDNETLCQETKADYG